MGSCASKAPTDKVILPKPNSCQCHLMESPDKETDSMISIQQDKTCLNCYRMHRLDFKCGSYRRIKSSDTSSVSQGTQTDIPPPNRKSRHRKIEGIKLEINIENSEGDELVESLARQTKFTAAFRPSLRSEFKVRRGRLILLEPIK